MKPAFDYEHFVSSCPDSRYDLSDVAVTVDMIVVMLPLNIRNYLVCNISNFKFPISDLIFPRVPATIFESRKSEKKPTPDFPTLL